MTKHVQLTITVGDQQLSIEGDFAKAEFRKLSGALTATHEMKLTSAAAHGPEQSGLSEEQLIAAKSPHGHSEKVAVLAYALQQAGIVEFTPDDIKRAYNRAHERPPKVVAQALRDAKNKYDYVEPGKKKGTFRLSPHGERTVVYDLPRKQRTRTE